MRLLNLVSIQTILMAIVVWIWWRMSFYISQWQCSDVYTIAYVVEWQKCFQENLCVFCRLFASTTLFAAIQRHSKDVANTDDLTNGNFCVFCAHTPVHVLIHVRTLAD